MAKTHDHLQYYLQITSLLRTTIFAKINSEYNIKLPEVFFTYMLSEVIDNN